MFRQKLGKSSLDEIIVNNFQVNLMRPGHVVEVHNHALTELTAVLALQRAEKGGVHFTCANMRQDGNILHDVAEGTFILNPGETFHGVTAVEAGGPRLSLVWAVNRLFAC